MCRSCRVKPSSQPWNWSYTYFLSGGSEGSSVCLEASEETKILLSKRIINYDCSNVNIVPKLLCRLNYPECHMVVHCLCSFCSYSIRSLCSVPNLRPFGRFRCNCTAERRNLREHSYRLAKGEIFRYLYVGLCRTWLRQTDSLNCETETAKRTL